MQKLAIRGRMRLGRRVGLGLLGGCGGARLAGTGRMGRFGLGSQGLLHFIFEVFGTEGLLLLKGISDGFEDIGIFVFISLMARRTVLLW